MIDEQDIIARLRETNGAGGLVAKQTGVPSLIVAAIARANGIKLLRGIRSRMSEADAKQYTRNMFGSEESRSRANATLARQRVMTAAAPALLAAAVDAYALLTGTGQDGTMGHHPDDPVPAALRAAIAKATGENA